MRGAAPAAGAGAGGLAELLASGKIRYEDNEYVPTGFARRAFQACNVDTSATGTTVINGYDYLTMKGSGVRIKDLR